MKKLLLLLSVVSIYTPSLMAHVPKDVDILIKKHEYAKAIAFLTPLAAQENAEAQNKLGEIYHNLNSFQESQPSSVQDYAKAREWYSKAAAQGHGEAANHLGRIYLNGEGVPKDEAMAMHWYKKGMNLGNAQAEVNYYAMTDNPFYYILQKAIDGDSEARQVVAKFYHSGGKIIIKKDTKKAALYREIKPNH